MGNITRNFANLITANGPSAVADGSVTNADLAGNINFKNLIINGDMSIAQRATSATTLGHQTYHTVDRWSQNLTSSTLAFTGEQSTDSPDGFDYSYKISCTTAEASLAASSRLLPYFRVEDSNLGYLKFGSSSAVDLTMSFYVKSNKTGTYQINLFHNNVSGFISATYTINSASTWEKKIITFKGDQGTTMDNDAGVGLQLEFVLAAGSDYTGGTFIPNTTTTYPAYTGNARAVNQGVNLADNTSNTWQITGLQLEVGSTESDFEFLPYDVNLGRCQRYYEKSYAQGTTPGTVTTDGRNTYYFSNTGSGYVGGFLKYIVTKRTTPTVTIYAPGNGTSGDADFYIFGSSTTQGSITLGGTNDAGFEVYRTGTSCNAMAFHFEANAEL